MKSLNNILIILVTVLITTNCQKDEPSDDQSLAFQKSFGGAFEDVAKDFISTNEFYYILGEGINEVNFNSALLIKTDNFGNRLWEKNYNYQGKSTTGSQIIKLEDKNEFAMIGTVVSDADSLLSDILFLHFDSQGNIITEKAINIAQRSEQGVYIQELLNGNFTIGALSSSDTSGSSVIKRYFFPIDINGSLVNGSLPRLETGSKIFDIYPNQTKTAYYVTGYDNGKPEITEITDIGNYTGDYAFEFNGEFNDLKVDDPSNIYVVGKIFNGNQGREDMYVAKLDLVAYEIVWELNIGADGNDWGKKIIETKDGDLLIAGSIEDTKLGTYDIHIAAISKSGEQINIKTIGGKYDEYGEHICCSDNGSFTVLATTYLENTSFISIIKTTFD